MVKGSTAGLTNALAGIDFVQPGGTGTLTGVTPTTTSNGIQASLTYIGTKLYLVISGANLTPTTVDVSAGVTANSMTVTNAIQAAILKATGQVVTVQFSASGNGSVAGTFNITGQITANKAIFNDQVAIGTGASLLPSLPQTALIIVTPYTGSTIGFVGGFGIGNQFRTGAFSSNGYGFGYTGAAELSQSNSAIYTNTSNKLFANSSDATGQFNIRNSSAGSANPEISITGNTVGGAAALSIYKTSNSPGGYMGIDCYQPGVGGVKLMVNEANGGSLAVGMLVGVGNRSLSTDANGNIIITPSSRFAKKKNYCTGLWN